METSSLNRRALRVSTIFNVLTTVVLVLGGIAAVISFFAGIAISDNTGAGIVVGLLYAIIAVIYAGLLWAGIQLSSLVAGYIYTRTKDEG